MQVFVSEKPEAVKPLVELLQKEVDAHQDKEFKAFVIFTKATVAEVEKLAGSVKAQGVALCVLKGPEDEAIAKYGINLDPSIKTTTIVYKDRSVTANFVNQKLPEQAQELSSAIAAACQK